MKRILPALAVLVLATTAAPAENDTSTIPFAGQDRAGKLPAGEASSGPHAAWAAGALVELGDGEWVFGRPPPDGAPARPGPARD